MNNPNLDLAPIIPGFRRALNAFLFDLRSLCPYVKENIKRGGNHCQVYGISLLSHLADVFKPKDYDPFGVASRAAWVKAATYIRPVPACMESAFDEHYIDRVEWMGRMFKDYINLKMGEE